MAEKAKFSLPIDLTPKLWTAFKEGFTPNQIRQDLIAALTVAIVALPLSMAIAIASNASPLKGLQTAFIAGFWISVLGGSRHQIGGPTAAFAIVVANVIGQHGLDGLFIATLMAGIILMLAGVFRLGAFMRFVPYPVVIGFTAGIAFTIFITQIAPFFGLKIEHMPSEIIERLKAIFYAFPSFNVYDILISLVGVSVILLLRKFRPQLPYFLIIVIAASLFAYFLHLPVLTVGEKYGVVKAAIPPIHIPWQGFNRVWELLPTALTIAFLAGIESLLSAVVADGMTGNHHRSNAELFAQGFANVASAISGGLPATGAIARTATNIRAGAKTPIAGVMHAVFLLIILFAAGGLTSYIPLSALAAILVVVAWNMAEADRVIRILTFSQNSDRIILLTTFFLTVFVDLTVAVEAGVVLSALIFMNDMAKSASSQIEKADFSDIRKSLPPMVEFFEMRGPLFFGAIGSFVEALGRIDEAPKAFILLMKDVPIIDASGVSALLDVVEKLKTRKTTLIITGLSSEVRKQLAKVRASTKHLDGVRYASDFDAALKICAEIST